MNSSEEKSESSEIEEQGDLETDIIRSELSTMSFEELQKLKEKIGAKVYKEALFSTTYKGRSNTEHKVFKRENKNRPREMSSKKPIQMCDGPTYKKKEIRDPRFDPLCGEFDKKEFSQNYKFLADIQINDIKAIRAELRETTNPERETQLRRLLQRLNDQRKANKKKTDNKEKFKQQRSQVEQEFKAGKLPHFKNKSESRVEALVKQYEDLKKEGTGRIQRHLKRRQQKVKKKSHKAPIGVIKS